MSPIERGALMKMKKSPELANRSVKDIIALSEKFVAIFDQALEKLKAEYLKRENERVKRKKGA